MNIRKEHDYSALFAGIDQSIRAELSQMELYCTLGQLICARLEKGAAVAAAAYLAEKYPDQAGFSARNVRRMRDFYRMYENAPELLAQAMHLGWTQNMVILEADLTLDERSWYIRAAVEQGWSKLTLQKKIAEAAHLTDFFVPVAEVRCVEQDEAAALILKNHKCRQNGNQYAKNGVKIWDSIDFCDAFWIRIAKFCCTPWPRGEPVSIV